jgi:hypothetical protein
MIDLIKKSDLQKLLAPQGGPCVSIYLPTPHVGLDSFRNPTRLKSLLAEAGRRLAKEWMNPPAPPDLLQPVHEFLEDEARWRDLGDGLVLFCSPQTFRSFRLPIAVENSVWIGERLHIKPLIPVLSHEDSYYLLAVSQNEVRLFSGTRHSLVETHLSELPESLVSALNLHQPEGLVEARTASHALHGKEGAVFHGQGAATQHVKEDILAYFRVINRALHDFVRDKHAPLVFAGVGYLFPIYCQANTYPHLWDKPVTGNPQGLSAAELHRHAVELLTPYFQRDLNEDRQHYGQAEGTDRTADDLEEILSAAQQGRVEVLFIATDLPQWGHFDSASGRLELAAKPGGTGDDLLDLAAYATLVHGGRVHVVQSTELPEKKAAIALFRYGAPLPASAITS